MAASENGLWPKQRPQRKLDHAGIVPIYEVGESQNEPYLVMKLIKGENLAQRLQRGTTVNRRYRAAWHSACPCS